MTQHFKIMFSIGTPEKKDMRTYDANICSCFYHVNSLQVFYFFWNFFFFVLLDARGCGSEERERPLYSVDEMRRCVVLCVCVFVCVPLMLCVCAPLMQTLAHASQWCALESKFTWFVPSKAGRCALKSRPPVCPQKQAKIGWSRRGFCFQLPRTEGHVWNVLLSRVRSEWRFV